MKEFTMKKLVCFLVVGIALVSMSLFAQTFDGGAYGGPVLEPITIADLPTQEANAYVIVSGVLALQRLPGGRYVLVDGEGEEQVSVVVRADSLAWSNLEVDGETPVLVYGIVLKSDSSIEILAERIGFPAE
jgi:uncharacterized protein YdeI (BOF family)